MNLAADEGPHTFTVVAKKDEPRTAAQLFNCKICDKLAQGARRRSEQQRTAEVPVPRERRRPEDAAARSTSPGDSGVTGKGKKGESIDLKVTAPAGTKLYFMCLIHPWMQAEVDVT